MNRYIVVKNQCLFEGASQIEFGISYVEVCDDNIAVLSSVPNLSPDYKAVERLVNFCNDLQLDPAHLHDVAEDFVVEH